MLGPRLQSGMSLIEIAVSLSIVAIMMALAYPGYQVWIQNTQIRTAAEAIQNGLQLARIEALRRNTKVRFQLVTGMDAACALGGDGTGWLVSRADPTGLCHVQVSETAAPFTMHKRDGLDGSPHAIAAVLPSGASTATFDSLGRVVANGDGSPSLAQIEVTSSRLSASDARRLRVVLSSAGEVRMCDPNVPAGDARSC